MLITKNPETPADIRTIQIGRKQFELLFDDIGKTEKENNSIA